MLHPAPLRRFIWIAIAGILIGALYGDVHHGTPGVGAMVGGSMGPALFSLERFVLRRNAGGLLRPAAVFALSCAALAALRRRHPHHQRHCGLAHVGQLYGLRD